MTTVTVKLKTHAVHDITDLYVGRLNPCIIHGSKPNVTNTVAGRDKDNHYIVTCGHDECSKISMDGADESVNYWNKYNPIS